VDLIRRSLRGSFQAIPDTYHIDNIVIKDLAEWIALSGDVGEQIAHLPDGAPVQIRLE
jgi:hypothetical protein